MLFIIIVIIIAIMIIIITAVVITDIRISIINTYLCFGRIQSFKVMVGGGGVIATTLVQQLF